MKLVADYNTHKFLAFPSFVNRGFVERVIPGQSPSIEFEAGETIHLAKDDTPKIVKLPQVLLLPLPVLLLFRRIFRTFLIGTRSSIYHITKTGTCKGGNGGKTLLSPSFWVMLN